MRGVDFQEIEPSETMSISELKEKDENQKNVMELKIEFVDRI